MAHDIDTPDPATTTKRIALVAHDNEKAELLDWARHNRALLQLIFFWDPLQSHPHDPDVRALLRIAVLWDIPLACNRASADHIISSPLLSGSYQRRRPHP